MHSTPIDASSQEDEFTQSMSSFQVLVVFSSTISSIANNAYTLHKSHTYLPTHTHTSSHHPSHRIVAFDNIYFITDPSVHPSIYPYNSKRCFTNRHRQGPSTGLQIGQSTMIGIHSHKLHWTRPLSQPLDRAHNTHHSTQPIFVYFFMFPEMGSVKWELECPLYIIIVVVFIDVVIVPLSIIYLPTLSEFPESSNPSIHLSITHYPDKISHVLYITTVYRTKSRSLHTKRPVPSNIDRIDHVSRPYLSSCRPKKDEERKRRRKEPKQASK